MVAAYTLIRAVSAAHIAIGYTFINNPKKIAEQAFVDLLGDALGLSQPSVSFHKSTLASGLLGLVFVLSAISDIVGLSGSEEVSRGYWNAQGIFAGERREITDRKKGADE
jgi:hypothetical protein